MSKLIHKTTISIILLAAVSSCWATSFYLKVPIAPVKGPNNLTINHVYTANNASCKINWVNGATGPETCTSTVHSEGDGYTGIKATGFWKNLWQGPVIYNWEMSFTLGLSYSNNGSYTICYYQLTQKVYKGSRACLFA